FHSAVAGRLAQSCGYFTGLHEGFEMAEFFADNLFAALAQGGRQKYSSFSKRGAVTHVYADNCSPTARSSFEFHRATVSNHAVGQRVPANQMVGLVFVEHRVPLHGLAQRAFYDPMGNISILGDRFQVLHELWKVFEVT